MFSDNEDEEALSDPVARKKAQIITAVEQNQVDRLRSLLDSPGWYSTTTENGGGLLEVAILNNNVEVFDYMLSLPDFPLEHRNCEDQTPFLVSVTAASTSNLDPFYLRVNEHFACELIKKGVHIDESCCEGSSPLHHAMERHYYEVVKLLIQQGVDLDFCNKEGDTPLEFLLRSLLDVTELAMMLLVAGARPSMKAFEISVMNRLSTFVQDTLYMYVFDELTDDNIRLEVILQLAVQNQELFYEVIKWEKNVIIGDALSGYEFFSSLDTMGVNELKIIIDKFSSLLQEVFLTRRPLHLDFRMTSLQNCTLILKSDLCSSFINFLNESSDLSLVGCLTNRRPFYEATVSQVVVLLLTYGVQITRKDMLDLYRAFGYCDLFKTLLNVEIIDTCSSSTKVNWCYVKRDFFPVLIYDIHSSLETFLNDPERYSDRSVRELSRFFVHPRLRQIYLEMAERRVVPKRELPQIPLLVELARNAYRPYFVRRFGCKSAKDFYPCIKELAVDPKVRRIISYEQELY